MQSEMKEFNGNPSSHGRARLKGVAEVTCEKIQRRGAKTQRVLKMMSDSKEHAAILTLEGHGMDAKKEHLIPPNETVKIALDDRQKVTKVYGRHHILQ